MVTVVEMEVGEPTGETLTIKLPVKVNISYEFWNPYKDEKEAQTKFSINVTIFLTRNEAEMLEDIITNKMVEILNIIFEARKLEQEIETTEKAFKDVFNANPA
jgi:hypothetical protein